MAFNLIPFVGNPLRKKLIHPEDFKRPTLTAILVRLHFIRATGDRFSTSRLAKEVTSTPIGRRENWRTLSRAIGEAITNQSEHMTNPPWLVRWIDEIFAPWGRRSYLKSEFFFVLTSGYAYLHGRISNSTCQI